MVSFSMVGICRYGVAQKAINQLLFFVDIDECIELKPCINNGTCYNNNGSYVCDCQQGWHGQHCEIGMLFNIVN